MIKKALLLSALLLVSSPIVYAEQTLVNASVPAANQEALKRSLLDSMLENIHKHEPTKKFYDNLSQDKKQEVTEILTNVETIFAQIMEQVDKQMNALGQAHKELIEEYKQTCKVKNFNINFNFELTPVTDN